MKHPHYSHKLLHSTSPLAQWPSVKLECMTLSNIPLQVYFFRVNWGSTRVYGAPLSWAMLATLSARIRHDWKFAETL